MRRYKEREPEETIDYARACLSRVGLLPFELSWWHPSPGLYSCRLSLDETQGGYGVNGKGGARAWCLASAYGELMERVQNGMLQALVPLRACDAVGGAGPLFANERELTPDELSALPALVTQDLFGEHGPQSAADFEALWRAAEEQGAGAYQRGVPFVDASCGKEVWLPWRCVFDRCRTGGMAAGNTQDEARYQALCELCERSAAAEIFTRDLTPPDLDRALLKGCLEGCEAELDKLDAVARAGHFRVWLKDFSLGRDLPVVAVVLQDPRTGHVYVKAGSDTSLPVALSRCLTEAFQGIASLDAFRRIMRPLATAAEDPEGEGERDRAGRAAERFYWFQFNGRGAFGARLLGDTPSWAPSTAPFTPQASHAAEVTRFVQLFAQRQTPVYWRDVDWLGFPAVQLYVPGISSLPRTRLQRRPLPQQWRLAKALLGLATAESIDLALCATHLRELADEFPGALTLDRVLQLPLRPGARLAETPASYLEALLWCRQGDLPNAIRAMTRVLADIQCTDPLARQKAELAWLEATAAGQSPDAATATLKSRGFADDDVAWVATAWRDPSTLLSLLDDLLPRCDRGCAACPVAGDCLAAVRVQTHQRIHQRAS